MVTTSRKGSGITIIARPNCSASWSQNLLVLISLAIPSLGCAIGFALAGAWPILPLAGLEIFALGCALYYVSRKQQYRHVITVSPDAVQIDKGFHAPCRSWILHRQRAGLAITLKNHSWEGPELALHDEKETVTVGGFLNRDDREKLAALLRTEMPVGTFSPQIRSEF